MRVVLPVVSSLSVMLTACSSKAKSDTALANEAENTPKLVGEWLCFEMDGVGFPVVYSEEDIAGFTSNANVVGMEKVVFMSIQETYEGMLTSHFYYDYADGSEGLLEAPLPLSAQGSFPFFQIESYEDNADQSEIILDCRLSEARILGCGYSIGGMSPDGASISFRPRDDA